MKTVVIICRGHSGSRSIATFFTKNGFFFGNNMNVSMDKKPYNVMEGMSRYCINNCYKFKGLDFNIKIDKTQLNHIKTILNNKYLYDILPVSQNKGWKLTSTIFIYPLLVQIHPDFYYLWLTRSISKKNEHSRGNANDRFLSNMGKIKKRNVIEKSWYMHYQIVKKTPKPKNFLHLKFEDFILDQETQVKRIEDWLEMKLPGRIKVYKDRIFPNDHYNLKSKFLIEPMIDLGYINNKDKVCVYKNRYWKGSNLPRDI